MSFRLHRNWCVAVVLLAVLVGGCSQIEPQTGTRVTFSIDQTKSLTRPQIAQLSRYLLKKSDSTLGNSRARVESVDNGKLVLLLPGEKVTSKRAGLLLDNGDFEFRHLTNVVTAKNPGRSWRLEPPKGEQKSYLFSGPNNQRLDSTKDSENLILKNVVTAGSKPVLNRDDMEPTAMYLKTEQGWALLIRFNEAGAKKLHQFSSTNRGEYLAVFNHGKLINAAEIVDPIKGGEVFLTGFSTEAEVNALVTDINGADLPGRLKVESVEYY